MSICDAIQPSHPLWSTSPAFNLSQHQGLFQWVSSLHHVAKVLEFQLQHQSFPWTPRADLLQNGLVGSPCGPRDSQESSPTPQLRNINSSPTPFFSPNLSLISSRFCFRINPVIISHLFRYFPWFKYCSDKVQSLRPPHKTKNLDSAYLSTASPVLP